MFFITLFLEAFQCGALYGMTGEQLPDRGRIIAIAKREQENVLFYNKTRKYFLEIADKFQRLEYTQQIDLFRDLTGQEWEELDWDDATNGPADEVEIDEEVIEEVEYGVEYEEKYWQRRDQPNTSTPTPPTNTNRSLALANVMYVDCYLCNGKGFNSSSTKECVRCKGTGEVLMDKQYAISHGYKPQTETVKPKTEVIPADDDPDINLSVLELCEKYNSDLEKLSSMYPFEEGEAVAQDGQFQDEESGGESQPDTAGVREDVSTEDGHVKPGGEGYTLEEAYHDLAQRYPVLAGNFTVVSDSLAQPYGGNAGAGVSEMEIAGTSRHAPDELGCAIGSIPSARIESQPEFTEGEVDWPEANQVVPSKSFHDMTEEEWRKSEEAGIVILGQSG